MLTQKLATTLQMANKTTVVAEILSKKILKTQGIAPLVVTKDYNLLYTIYFASKFANNVFVISEKKLPETFLAEIPQKYLDNDWFTTLVKGTVLNASKLQEKLEQGKKLYPVDFYYDGSDPRAKLIKVTFTLNFQQVIFNLNKSSQLPLLIVDASTLSDTGWLQRNETYEMVTFNPGLKNLVANFTGKKMKKTQKSVPKPQKKMAKVANVFEKQKNKPPVKKIQEIDEGEISMIFSREEIEGFNSDSS